MLRYVNNRYIICDFSHVYTVIVYIVIDHIVVI